MMMDIPPLAWVLFPLIGGLGFTIRGIAGHQIGGTIMGIATALMWSYLLDLPFLHSMVLAFIMAITWALVSFVGWAQYGPGMRFFRGFLVYGLIPAAVLMITLVSWGILFEQYSSSIIGVVVSLFSGLGSGLGFCLGTLWINYSRRILTEKYAQNHPNKRINFSGDNYQPDEIPQSKAMHFDSWKYCLEIPTGALWGLGNLVGLWCGGRIILDTPFYTINLAVFGIIAFLVIVIVFPLLVFFDIIHFHTIHGEPPTFGIPGGKPFFTVSTTKKIFRYIMVSWLIFGLFYWLFGEPLQSVGALFLSAFFGLFVFVCQFRHFRSHKMFTFTEYTDIMMYLVILFIITLHY